jgi:membrane protease YdiL (CAAX protease family)
MKAARLVSLAGVATVVVLVIATVVGGETPDGDDSVRRIVSFYRDNDSEQQWAAALVTWGLALFLLFASGLWRVLRDAETERRAASSLALVGSALFAVGGTIFAGLTFTSVTSPTSWDRARCRRALNSDMFFPSPSGCSPS